MSLLNLGLIEKYISNNQVKKGIPMVNLLLILSPFHIDGHMGQLIYI